MAGYVYDFAEGSLGLVELLGGKGANLAEMQRLGLPVPPGFIVTTEACREYLRDGRPPAALSSALDQALARLERAAGRRLGDPTDPLLVSVRSGSPASMPGMMETVLDVGLNDESVVGLGDASGDKRFAWDSYRRLLQMFGTAALGIDAALFTEVFDQVKRDRGARTDLDLDVWDLQQTVARFKMLILQQTGQPFPQDPHEQLELAVLAVFSSWNTPRAQVFRRREHIPDTLGTAVTVMAMVYGNIGTTSGTGVAFTRDPLTGEPLPHGNYLEDAQGEDVVAGIRTPEGLAGLARQCPDAYTRLLEVLAVLERHYRDLCDVEFTVERGELWLLQVRIGKRTAAAAFRIASRLVDEGLIDEDRALLRVTGDQLAQLMVPRFDHRAAGDRIAHGLSAVPGAACGVIVLDAATAVARQAAGESVVLVREETHPEDLPGMLVAAAIVTARGGRASHAAFVARGLGTTCVCDTDTMRVDVVNRSVRWGGTLLHEGDVISVDGTTGEVFAGRVDVVPSAVAVYLQYGLPAALDGADDETHALLRSVDRLLRHADSRRTVIVRADADTPEDAARARRYGAEGIGLATLSRLPLPLPRRHFIDLLSAMDGLPVVIRLFDQPEPDLYAPQARVIAEAVASRIRDGGWPKAELVVPFTTVDELHRAAQAISTVVDQVVARENVRVHLPVGTIVDLPAPGFPAGAVAKEVALLCFGTDHDGRLPERAVTDARTSRPVLKVAACGQHATEPAGLAYYQRIGADYVSCPPYRVPVARLEAGRAAAARTADPDAR